MRDEVLALLEDGPHPEAELLEWLGLTALALRPTLTDLKRLGLVKRVGTKQDWALASYVTHAGRKWSVDLDTCVVAIATALRPHPLSTEQLVALTGYKKHVLKHQCARLVTAGTLCRSGVGRASRWSLAGHPTVPRDTVRPTVARPPRLDAPLLRQLTPIVTTVKPTDPPSWWVTAQQTRESFAAAARQRDLEMQSNAQWRQQSVQGIRMNEGRGMGMGDAS